MDIAAALDHGFFYAPWARNSRAIIPIDCKAC